MHLRSLSAVALTSFLAFLSPAQTLSTPQAFPGYRDFTAQAKLDQAFMAVPDAKLAGEELKELTKAPHIASSKEDHDTVEYVAAKFKAAGLETSIVPYKVWLNFPKEIHLEATAADGKVLMTGPTREHVEGDPFQDDPRVVTPYNSSSTSVRCECRRGLRQLRPPRRLQAPRRACTSTCTASWCWCATA